LRAKLTQNNFVRDNQYGASDNLVATPFIAHLQHSGIASGFSLGDKVGNQSGGNKENKRQDGNKHKAQAD
jgi:hypothetical protein